MASTCPRCGERFFICGFCNSELFGIEAVILEDNACMTHYCSVACVEEDARVMERSGNKCRIGLFEKRTLSIPVEQRATRVRAN